MSPAELRRLGEVLYGRRWQTALASDLGVNRKTIERWLGGRRISEQRASTLRVLIVARIAALTDMI